MYFLTITLGMANLQQEQSTQQFRECGHVTLVIHTVENLDAVALHISRQRDVIGVHTREHIALHHIFRLAFGINTTTAYNREAELELRCRSFSLTIKGLYMRAFLNVRCEASEGCTLRKYTTTPAFSGFGHVLCCALSGCCTGLI